MNYESLSREIQHIQLSLYGKRKDSFSKKVQYIQLLVYGNDKINFDIA